MKFSALSTFTSLVVSSQLVSAASLPPVGAAFFLTNEPTGNFIVSSNIGSDGKLTFANAVSAGGVGGHGLPITGADPLFSMGSIRKSPDSNILATVNAGSNTVVVFTIDPSNPSKITMIGRPVSSGGEFPVSVAINKSGSQVCVLNGGAVNGIKCFSVDRTRGLIAHTDGFKQLGVNQTTPPNGPLGTVGHIAFSDDESKLIVTVKGLPPASGFLAMWQVAADGRSTSSTFTKSSPASGGLTPFSMATIPGTEAFVVADASVGFEVFSFHGNTATSTVVPITDQLATCWVTRSAQTGNFYLSDPTLQALTEVHVDANLKGSIVKQYPQTGMNMLDSDLVPVSRKDFLFVLSPDTLSIEVFAPNAPGQLQHVQSFDFAASAQKADVAVHTPNVQGIATWVRT